MVGEETTWHARGAMRRGCGALALLVGAAGLAVAGCASTPREDVDAHALVWPSPPAEPRIAYVRSIANPLDLGARQSLWRRGVNALTGAVKGREPLVRPFGVALDEHDNLCITDPGAGAVGFFDGDSRRFYRWEKAGSQRFVSPVAVAKKNDTVFVADTGLKKVLAFDLKGRLVFEIDDEVERPSALLVLGGTLYVADAARHRILARDLRSGELSWFGKRGTEPGAFNFPTHLASDGERLYVTDSMNFRIQVVNTRGECEGVIGRLGDGSGQLSRPKGVSVDDQGRVYVVDALFDNLQIFDAEGRFLLHWGAAGTASGEFWLPAGVAVGRDHAIYVADSYNRRIQMFRYIGEL